MNKILTGVGVCLYLCCVSCGDKNTAQNTTQLPQTQTIDEDTISGLGEMRVETYKGLLPAASCPGIEYRLTIQSPEYSGDGTFRLTLTYLNAENGKDKTYTYTGRRFTQRGIPGDDNATVWQCISEDDSQTFNFLCEDENKLTLLNSKFEKPESTLNYSLTRVTD